jgi:hypothetical protein
MRFGEKRRDPRRKTMSEKVADPVKLPEVNASPFVAGVKRWFYYGLCAAALIAGGVVKITEAWQERSEAPGRAVASDVAVPAPTSPWLMAEQMKALRKDFEDTKAADAIEHQTSRNHRALLDQRTLADRTELNKRVERIENGMDRLTEQGNALAKTTAELKGDVKLMLDILRNQPKKYSGPLILAPGASAETKL